MSKYQVCACVCRYRPDAAAKQGACVACDGPSLHAVGTCSPDWTKPMLQVPLDGDPGVLRAHAVRGGRCGAVGRSRHRVPLGLRAALQAGAAHWNLSVTLREWHSCAMRQPLWITTAAVPCKVKQPLRDAAWCLTEWVLDKQRWGRWPSSGLVAHFNSPQVQALAGPSCPSGKPGCAQLLTADFTDMLSSTI